MENTNPNKIANYRPDIDGLRALAVIPVVLHHAGVGLFGGGFVGVDVFFVISGYLITRILINDLRKDKFSIITFYERRVRRIFPAFFAVLFPCVIVASVFYLPLDFKQFGASVTASTLFTSNFLFWSEVNYFGSEAVTKPLLHTWSLAVEEQFYICFPVFLMVLWRFGKRIVFIAVTLISVISFSVCVYASSHHPSVNFYFPVTRAWELLVGAILALEIFPTIRSKALLHLVSFAGLFMILYAIFGISVKTPFPGFAALLPVLGTAFLIESGRCNDSMVRKFISSSPLVWIGLISYSLYLWHWPIIVFYRYLNIFPLEILDIVIVITVSLLLAAISWQFVEQPFRQRRAGKTRSILFSQAICMMVLFSGIGFFIYKKDGLESRLDPEVVRLSKYSLSRNAGGRPYKEAKDSEWNAEKNLQKTSKHKVAIYGADREPKLAIFGDSHAYSMAKTLGRIAGERGESLVLMAFPGFAPTIDLYPHVSHDEFMDWAMNRLSMIESVEFVFIACHWAEKIYGSEVHETPLYSVSAGRYLSKGDLEEAVQGHFRQTVDKILSMGKKIVLIYDNPVASFNVPRALAIGKMRGLKIEEFGIPAEVYRERNILMFTLFEELAKDDEIYTFDPNGVLKMPGSYRVYKDGHSLYWDDNHLSEEGHRLFEDRIREMLDYLLTR